MAFLLNLPESARDRSFWLTVSAPHVEEEGDTMLIPELNGVKPSPPIRKGNADKESVELRDFKLARPDFGE